ncbi:MULTISPECIES: winged helix-turn-helix transcriptional regulator [unclassified Neisseria]|uniref:winged helix-turn-helix transcriptional regulator n=1 Tax=unclassified Neisseria TaxID=2623750 RepID=UPI002666616F|nr:MULTISPECIES: winged helix-turn-helix transcriptional regulator [unclassified Neisseria]MDO1510648.1 winged helix-turn-helix transcriptional regulator [Neisseria sp. MVDL19-042950]MDO1516228.1 winged helix-turn-helix transcriptional regulator [Neisseria sp. MVDL18-041461]MDO1564300.1 winged helix-turn-helix transcriptional regulator [Neisseria sp. MVDL20-010259]
MKELDKTDRKILKILQQNARIPMTELAEKVGLSTTPVTERVRRLERENIITGYHAHLNPHALGQSLLVFVEIKLRSKSGNIFEDFRREVSMIPQILECHLVSGEYDYLIKVRLPDMSAYRDMLGNILLQLPAAAESRSYVVMEEVKEDVLLHLD